MTKDPICRMTVAEATALCAKRDGRTIYYCVEHCRQKFLSAPDRVFGPAIEGTPTQTA